METDSTIGKDNIAGKDSPTVKTDDITPFIPEIYKDLWELGSNPDIKFELLDKQIITRDKPSIIDIGCGKGAELIQLARRFEFSGTGLDIIPEFIEEANFRKIINECPHLSFIVEDCKKNISNYSDFDLIIYHYDPGWFGDIAQTLNVFRKVVSKEKGHVLFDIAYLRTQKSKGSHADYETYSEVKKQISSAAFQILSYIYWDKNNINRMNEFTNLCIEKRIAGLTEKFPDKKEVLDAYCNKQKEKARVLETEFDIMTCLLKKN